jgi:hypothetical protein
MAEDGPEAIDGVAAEDRVGAPPGRRGIRGRHVVMAAVLLAAASMTLWIVGAARALDAYDDVVGPAVDCSPRSVSGDLEALEEELASLPDEGRLAPVAQAFRSHFSQERWSFEDGELRLSRDGDILHRRDRDGWEAIRRGDDAVARVDGSRYWVPECANIRIYLMLFVGNGAEVGCVEQATAGAEVVTSWVAGAEDGTCGGGFPFEVRTSSDGELLQWTAGTSTYRVVEPEPISWPPVHRRVPAFLHERR